MSAGSEVCNTSELMGMILEDLPAHDLLRVRRVNRQSQAIVDQGAANGVGIGFFLKASGDAIPNHQLSPPNVQDVRLNTLLFTSPTQNTSMYMKRDPLTAPGAVFGRMFITQPPVQVVRIRCVFIMRDKAGVNTGEEETITRWVEVKDTNGITHKAVADQMLAAAQAYIQRFQKIVLRLDLSGVYTEIDGVNVTN